MSVFKNEDDSYQNWVKNNPHGFVVNTRNERSHEYRVAHKASCRFISDANNPARSTKTISKFVQLILQILHIGFIKTRLNSMESFMSAVNVPQTSMI